MPFQNKDLIRCSLTGGLLIEKVAPEYPTLAKQESIQGQVTLHAVISKTGTIRELNVVAGDPIPTPAASKAVSQWEYRPVEIVGQPTEVETTITVDFMLPTDSGPSGALRTSADNSALYTESSVAGTWLSDSTYNREFLELVSKIGSASSQALTLEVVELLSFCHEEEAKAVDGRTVEVDRALAPQAEAAAG